MTCAIARFDEPEVIQVIKFPPPTPNLAPSMPAKPMIWHTETVIELSIFSIDEERDLLIYVEGTIPQYAMGSIALLTHTNLFTSLGY